MRGGAPAAHGSLLANERTNVTQHMNPTRASTRHRPYYGRTGLGSVAHGGKRQGNRTPGDPRVPTLPPCHPRPYETNPLPCSFHKIPTLERMASPAPLPSHGDCQTSGSHEKEAAEKCKVHRHNRYVAARMAGNLPGPG